MKGWTPQGALLLGFFVLIPVSFALDAWALELANQPIKSGQLRTSLVALRFFGDGAPVVLMTLAALCADPKRWRSVLVILLATFATGFIVDQAKRLSARPRPIETLPGGDALGNTTNIHGRNSSFPSGHSATAFAFARGISLMFPRLAPAVYLAATGTAVSRMHELRHYLSDCVVGGLFGWIVMTLAWRLAFGPKDPLTPP